MYIEEFETENLTDKSSSFVFKVSVQEIAKPLNLNSSYKWFWFDAIKKLFMVMDGIFRPTHLAY